VSQPISTVRVTALVREAAVSAAHQVVASVLTLAMIAGMCCAVLLTEGAAVGARDAVVATLDAADTRAIVVRVDGAGVDVTVLDRLAHIDDISWAVAFGSAADVTNAAIPAGTRVPLRRAWCTDWTQFGLPTRPADGHAYVSRSAAEQLGMDVPAGAVRAVTGAAEHAVIGWLSVPTPLRFLEPFQVVPEPLGGPETIGMLVVVAARSELVAPLTAVIGSVLAAEDVTKVSVETSQALTALRDSVRDQLGGYGRQLTLGVFSATAVMSGGLSYAMVMLRRKDYGRRRALGASRGLVVGLVLLQAALLGLGGAVVGVVVALGALAATDQPAPGPRYCLSVGVLATTVAVVASIIPAIAAARREPVAELRVP
jgi:putative ABC transport system permease protein